MARNDEFFGPSTVLGDAATLQGFSTNETGILDAVDLPIIVITRDCRVAGINRAARTMLRLPASSVGGSLCNSLAGVENLDRLCTQVMADGLAYRRETRDGERTFLLRIAPYTGSDRQILGAVLTFTNVTAFRASINQAIYEREYTKAILNTVIDPLVVLDAKLQVQTANRAFYDLFGLSRDQTQSISIRKLGNSEWETSEVWKSVETTLSGHTQFQAVEIEREFPAIGWRTVVINARSLPHDGNALILLTFQDVSDRKRTERALRETEERFRAIVETTPECVKVVSADGILLHMNLPGLRMVGARTAVEVLGKSVYDLIAPEDRERFKIFNNRICQGEQGSLQFDMIGLDGTRRHLETHAAPLRNPDGTVVHLAVTSDISERKKAEQALRESEQRYRVITEASPIMVWMSGTDKLCYYFNKSWLEFVGRALEQESGNGWAENVHPDDFDRCLQIYVSSFDARRPFEMEYRLRHHSGQYRWIIDHGVPRYAPDGTFEGYVGGCLDIHDQKEAGDKSRRADITVQLMKVQDEERRRIARDLHDSVGQTLTVLGINLALAQEAASKIPELASQMEQIQETVQQLHREIRTASYLLHPPLLDERGVRSAISWYLEGLQKRGGLEIQFEISENFGRFPADMELMIFRLVQECLTNIHRHSESKTASIRIIRESNQIALDIEDQGKGMLPGRLADIQSGRSGLGIRGMRERLRQFDGTLNIESDSSGTRVFATIPLPKAASPNNQSDANPLQAAV